MGLSDEHRCGRCGKRSYKTQSWTWDNFCEECQIERKKKTIGRRSGEHRCYHCGDRFHKTQSWTWDNHGNLWHQICAEKNPEFRPQEPEEDIPWLNDTGNDPGRRDVDEYAIEPDYSPDKDIDPEPDYGPDEDIDPEERGY